MNACRPPETQSLYSHGCLDVTIHFILADLHEVKKVA